MTIDELQVVITANTSQLKKELSGVRGDLDKLQSSTSTIATRIPRAFAVAGTAVVAFGTIIGNLVTQAFRSLSQSIGSAVTRLDTIKNYPKVMASLGFSASDAEKSIQVLSDRLLGLPTSLDQIVSSTQQLSTMSPTLASATERALALNNAFLAGGQGTESASRGFQQFSQMLATGKADMMGWRTLMETMPGQMKQLSISLLGAGGDSMKLQDAIMNGTVSMQQMADEVVKLNKTGLPGLGSFEEQARNATGGIGTAWENVKIAITRGIANIMDAIGQANIAGFFNNIASAINAVVPYVIAFVRLIIAGVSWVSTLFGGGAVKANAMTTATNASATAMSNVGANASNASGAIDGTTASAKKLQNQLAGFDQMTVLTPPSDSGSGGGGGGGGGTGVAMQFPDTSGDVAKIDKVQVALDNIKKAFGEFVKNPFVKGIIEVFKTIGDGAVWLWTYGIAPLLAIVWQPFVDFFVKLGENAPLMEALGILLGSFALALGIVGIAMVIWTVIMGVATAVGTAFGAVMAFITSPIGAVILIIAILIAIIVLMVKYWDNIKQVAIDVWNGIVAVWNVVAQWFMDFVITPLVNFFAGLWQAIQDIFATVGNWFKGVFTGAWNGIVAVWNGVGAWFGGVWNGIVGVFAGVGAWFGSIFAGAWQGIQNVFNAVGGFFRGVWNTITGIFGSIGSAIGDTIGSAFKTVVNSIIGFAERTINGFIDAINGAIGLINKIPGVHIGTLSRLSIPRMAKGGVVNSATLAVVGESGKEAVMPLENNTGWIDTLASKLNAQGGNQPTQITVKIGEDTIIRRVIDGINDMSYQNGEAVILA